MSEEAPDLTGKMIGEYYVVARIGSGGMGAVYEGRHPLIGKRVAVKVLLPHLARQKEPVDRFLDEARAVNEIRHRGIVDIFGFGQMPSGLYYLVMEYLDGQSFETLIEKSGPVPLREVLLYLVEVLDALEAAHQAGVIHRDLKPSNIFLVDSGRERPYVKLLDFGVAKLGVLEGTATPQTRQSVVVGTPEYISPEQARGLPVSTRTDLYALGVVMFELLTGRRPFVGENPLQTMWMHVEAEAPKASALRPELPPEVDQLLQWMMKKDLQERPESAGVLRAHLKAIASLLAAAPAAGLDGPPPPPIMPVAVRRSPLPSAPPRPLVAAAPPPAPAPPAAEAAPPAKARPRPATEAGLPEPEYLAEDAQAPARVASLSALDLDRQRPEPDAHAEDAPRSAQPASASAPHLRRPGAEPEVHAEGPPRSAQAAPSSAQHLRRPGSEPDAQAEDPPRSARVLPSSPVGGGPHQGRPSPAVRTSRAIIAVLGALVVVLLAAVGALWARLPESGAPAPAAPAPPVAPVGPQAPAPAAAALEGKEPAAAGLFPAVPPEGHEPGSAVQESGAPKRKEPISPVQDPAAPPESAEPATVGQGSAAPLPEAGAPVEAGRKKAPEPKKRAPRKPAEGRTEGAPAEPPGRAPATDDARSPAQPPGDRIPP